LKLQDLESENWLSQLSKVFPWMRSPGCGQVSAISGTLAHLCTMSIAINGLCGSDTAKMSISAVPRTVFQLLFVGIRPLMKGQQVRQSRLVPWFSATPPGFAIQAASGSFNWVGAVEARIQGIKKAEFAR